jgi:hypothetical protein
MDPESIYQHLEQIAEKVGISIRYENLASSEVTPSSGLCRVRGRYLYIMDTSKDVDERIKALCQCLGQMDLEGIYVMPAVRELLDRWRPQGHESEND